MSLERQDLDSTHEWDLGAYRDALREYVEKVSSRYQAKFDESDVVQETLTEAYQHLHDFRGSTEIELRNWLRRMLARNLVDAIRRLRSQKRNVQNEMRISATISRSPSNQSFQLAGPFTSPSFRVARSEELNRMHMAIANLPAAQREAISLHHLRGMTLTEVAGHMGRTPGAIAGLIHRGLRSLQQSMSTSQ
ncbi:MAG: sigma-70 family RNA polymerase sigma factor [Planctomycetales bacterium]|nr:sigma-70 family RNA polymerase sigma factor [Planctomycetales bacterium]